MLFEKRDNLAKLVSEGVGTSISARSFAGSHRTGVKLWFADLEEERGPNILIQPRGLKGCVVSLVMGRFARSVLLHMRQASSESRTLATALFSTVAEHVELTEEFKTLESLVFLDESSELTLIYRGRMSQVDMDSALEEICKRVIVPVCAALAELIGYDEVLDEGADSEAAVEEGALNESTVKRRERNPRNRWLCLKLHGEICKACGFDYKRFYGNDTNILEVHHLEPLANQSTPRLYSPRTDLVPLCPNCHRAVHKRKPVPYTVEELQELIRQADVSNK